ncbi:MAG TPA: hypothetical protein VFE13_21410 [Caulobacteraceae bacterium]|jgi:hypothetical protein|nr:hypothetical protein [Caulobacteraceae bacterium]
MRRILVGLLAAVMTAILPAASHAADKPEAPAKLDPASVQKGMAAAPGVITQAGLDCNLANARLLGKNTDPKTKVTSTFYELACHDQEGFLVAVPDKEGQAQVFTCLEAANNPKSGAQCILPENADPKAGLHALVAKNKPNCNITAARAIGQTQDRTTTVFEVACQGGPGYIIDASFPVTAAKPATFAPCFAMPPGGTMKCTLTDDATSAAYISAMVAKMGKPCDLANQRYVGGTSDGETFFEVACKDGKGYMIEQAANGAIKPAIDCASADNIGGGCTLTNAREAQTAQAGLYTKLAHAAGFPCDVSRYAAFNVSVPGHEVVEMSCGNRPDGAIGIFPASASEKAQILDCAHSELAGYRCSFTKPDASLPLLTADLKKLGKTSCVVSGERAVGVTADKVGYIEVACADGNAGYLIAYTMPALNPKEAIVCTLAKEVVGGCQLPGNKKS